MKDNLRDICYATSHKIYGDSIPTEVVQRLEKELSGVIGNGDFY